MGKLTDVMDAVLDTPTKRELSAAGELVGDLSWELIAGQAFHSNTYSSFEVQAPLRAQQVADALFRRLREKGASVEYAVSGSDVFYVVYAE